MNNKIYYLCLLAIIMAGCSARTYRIAKVKATHQRSLPAPPGMVFVPSGSVLMGLSEIDSTLNDSSALKKVSLSAFYMDKTEVSNKQYRQFVNWVRDSIAVTDFIKEKSFFQSKGNGDTTLYINWSKISDGQDIWKTHNNRIKEKLQGMYYTGKEKLSGTNELNVSLFNYNYEVLNPAYTGRDTNARVIKESINIYPDTTVWAKDFPNSQNLQLVKSYFSNPIYDDFPVVGVSWKQARAFAAWRTKIWVRYVHKVLNPKLLQFPIDLPTEAQWAYAASDESIKLDTNAIKGKKVKGALYKANFKQGEGDYTQDGAAYTVPVTSYAVNKFGLYNMAGNVAEWTLNYYTESATAFVSDLNPILTHDAKQSDPLTMKRKVVMGGSWKDIGYFIRSTTRTYEFQDTPKSYIGFRCVMPAPDILMTEKTKTRNL